MSKQHENPELLSLAGQTRREAMLTELLSDLSGVRRRRRMRRGLLSTVGMLLLTLIYARYASFEPTNPSMNGESLATKAPSPTGTFEVIHVSTDESILQRMRPEASPIVMRINDRELLQTLVQIGRPAGLIRIGDRLALSAPVTDDELTSSVRNR